MAALVTFVFVALSLFEPSDSDGIRTTDLPSVREIPLRRFHRISFDFLRQEKPGGSNQRRLRSAGLSFEESVRMGYGPT